VIGVEEVEGAFEARDPLLGGSIAAEHAEALGPTLAEVAVPLAARLVVAVAAEGPEPVVVVEVPRGHQTGRLAEPTGPDVVVVFAVDVAVGVAV